MRPVERGPRPQNTNGKDIVFREYSDAREALISRMGEYCSFCEMHCDADLAVEHKLPKDLDKNSHLLLEWTNFLLACRNCNSTKGVKDIDQGDLVWPDSENTFFALIYGPSAIIRINPALSFNEHQRVQKLLDLVGVDKQPGIDPKLKDRRWRNRHEAWNTATDAYEDLKTEDTPIHRRRIVELAQAKGY